MSRSRDTADQINIIDSSAADATAITIDSSENVGIGTSSPNAVLTTDPESGNFSSTYNNYDGVGLFIRGNGTSGNGNYGPALVFGSCDSDTVNQDHKHAAISIVQTDTDPNQTGLAFWTHPSATAADALVNSMQITSAGNVGIGDTSPSRALSTKSSSVTVGSFESTSASGGLIGFVDPNTTNDVTVRVGALGNNLVLQAGGSERMRITSAGNVGIGITSPTQALVVSESSTPTIQIKDGAASGTRVSGRLHIGESDTTGVSIENSTNSYNDNCTMVFKTSPAAGTITERMRLTSGGDFMLGTSAVLSSSQEGIATVHAANDYWVLDIGNIRTTTQNTMRFFNGNGVVGTISTNGSATAYNTSSDYRLKTDAQPMTGASGRVQALNPVNFEWIADGTRVDGFLAHEAQAVVPEAITGEKDAMRDEEYEVTPAVEATYDDDGNELTAAVDAVMGTRSVPDYQGIDQSKIVPLLTAALQEALTEITALKTRVTALEAE